jgi:Family of unknown function (DUF5678)
MISTAEEIIENVRALPKFEREKFFKLVEEEKANLKPNEENLELRSKKFQLALEWIEKNKEEFDGQFVLLDGDQLIAHGKEPKSLYEQARKIGIEAPFVKRIKAKELPFGGW